MDAIESTEFCPALAGLNPLSLSRFAWVERDDDSICSACGSWKTSEFVAWLEELLAAPDPRSFVLDFSPSGFWTVRRSLRPKRLRTVRVQVAHVVRDGLLDDVRALIAQAKEIR